MEIYSTIIKPVITEKSVSMQADGKYSFFVHKKANKINIRQAVEGIYGVNVDSVDVMNIIKKTRKIQKGMMVKRRAMRKAIVTLKKGETLDFLKIKGVEEKKVAPKKTATKKPVKKTEVTKTEVKTEDKTEKKVEAKK